MTWAWPQQWSTPMIHLMGRRRGIWLLPASSQPANLLDLYGLGRAKEISQQLYRSYQMSGQSGNLPFNSQCSSLCLPLSFSPSSCRSLSVSHCCTNHKFCWPNCPGQLCSKQMAHNEGSPSWPTDKVNIYLAHIRTGQWQQQQQQQQLQKKWGKRRRGRKTINDLKSVEHSELSSI